MTTETNTVTTRINGVPVDKLFGTIEKMGNQPELAAFRFTARNKWVEGTASTSSVREWYGAGTDHDRDETYEFIADHPTLGNGHGPTPQEYVLHALASCITAGIVTGASARGITLHDVEGEVVGDIDVRGVLGIDPEVRNGYQQISATFTVTGDADEETLARLVEGSRKRSAVYEMLTNPTPVEVHSS